MVRAPALDAALEEALLRCVRERRAAERERAFEAVFLAMRDPLFGLCLHLAGSRAEAEDAVQETFLAVHRALPEFRGDARLSTWIWRIAIRAALRVRSRRPATDAVDDDRVGAAPANPGVAREERDRLRSALDGLSADHRLVLSLFAVEGLSHKEIAELLAIPEGTVWSRLHLARKQVARAMDA